MANNSSYQAAILISAVLWGTSFPVIKFGLEHVDAFQFALIRFVIASIILSLIVIVRGKRIPRWLWTDRKVWLLGLTNASGFFLQYAGMTMTGAIETSLLVNSNFVIVMLFSARFLGERLSRSVILALLLSELGVVMLTTGGDFSFIERSDFVGNMLVFLAGFVWVVYILVNKKLLSHKIETAGDSPGAATARRSYSVSYSTRKQRRNPDALSLMAIVLPLTAIIMSPAALYFSGSWGEGYSAEGWSAVLYVSVFCTATPFLLYTHGLKRVSAGASCILLLLEIVIASGIAATFLGETLSLVQIIGAVLIALGMISVSRGRPSSSKRIEGVVNQ